MERNSSGQAFRDAYHRWRVRKDGVTQPTIEHVCQAITDHFRVSQSELRSASRARSIVLARSYVMYLARELTSLSYTQIGAALGHRDHTTVLHACRKIAKRLLSDSSYQRTLTELKERIADHAPAPSRPPPEPSLAMLLIFLVLAVALALTDSAPSVPRRYP